MYNKLFTKILDSSIWLEPMPTRLVWLTFIAVMDEAGFVQFASVPNVALRARVPQAAAEKAIACLESPDPNSADPDNEGRRIEKVPGGWMVLNAEKYRDLVTRAVSKAQTRERVAKHRANKRNAPVTVGSVTSENGNGPVTPSEAYTEAEVRSEQERVRSDFERAWKAYPRKVGKAKALAAWKKEAPPITAVLSALSWQVTQPQWTKDRGEFIPHMATWLNQHRWEDEPFHAVDPTDAAFATVEDLFQRKAGAR